MKKGTQPNHRGCTIPLVIYGWVFNEQRGAGKASRIAKTDGKIYAQELTVQQNTHFTNAFWGTAGLWRYFNSCACFLDSLCDGQKEAFLWLPRPPIS